MLIHQGGHFFDEPFECKPNEKVADTRDQEKAERTQGDLDERFIVG
jgi:hypothetical protein